MFYVYEHWRTDRQECFYVGKGKGNRAYAMSRRNKHHQAIVAKLHRTGYAVEVKIVASGLSEEQAYSLEIERIAFWKDIGADLANISIGGIGGASGVPKTEEHKKKISAALKGQIISEERRKKHSETYKKNMTEERRNVLRQHAFERIDLFKQYQHLGPKASAKRVICIDDGLEFESASEAARYYNTAKSAIIELCNGYNKYRKTVVGKRFQYAEGA